MILLDTHALVWLDRGAPELGLEARDQVDVALREEGLAVSAVSFWEIATLCRRGRLRIDRPLEAWRRGLIDIGLNEVPLDGETALAAGALSDLHGDPADRMIVATAMQSGAMLVTADRKILDWTGSLRRLDASK